MPWRLGLQYQDLQCRKHEEQGIKKDWTDSEHSLCGVILERDHLIFMEVDEHISVIARSGSMSLFYILKINFKKTCFRAWNSPERGASPLICWISHIFYYVNPQMLMSLWRDINLQVDRTVACQLLKAQNSVLPGNLWRPLKAPLNKNMQEVWWSFSSFTRRFKSSHSLVVSECSLSYTHTVHRINLAYFFWLIFIPHWENT